MSRDYFSQERVVERRTFSVVDPRGTFDGEFVVRGYSILTTDLVVFEAYETTAGHSTVFTSPAHGRLGAVKSRPLPPEIAALPYGDERTAACQAWFKKLDAECEAIVAAGFPEVTMRLSDGHGYANLADVHEALGAAVA